VTIGVGHGLPEHFTGLFYYHSLRQVVLCELCELSFWPVAPSLLSSSVKWAHLSGWRAYVHYREQKHFGHVMDSHNLSCDVTETLGFGP